MRGVVSIPSAVDSRSSVSMRYSSGHSTSEILKPASFSFCAHLVDMKKEKVTCGRRADCDICLENVKTAYCNTQLYSSLHFTITKVRILVGYKIITSFKKEKEGKITFLRRNSLLIKKVLNILSLSLS